MKRAILAILFLNVDLASLLFALETREQLGIAPEDEEFWMRLLRTGEGSIPVPTNPPPIPNPPTPPVISPVQNPPILPPPIPNPPSPPPPLPSPVSPPITAPIPVTTITPVNPPTNVPIVIPPEVCNVDVSVSCVTESGASCNEIQPPNPVCSDGTEINSVTFGYSGNSCNPAGNNQGTDTFCEDFSPILFLDVVSVLCRDAAATETALVVEPPLVEPGATFTVTSPSGAALPDKIDCVFTDVDNVILQQVVIDTSGDVELTLNDEFGAFTLLSCQLPSSPEGGQTCLATLTYTVDVKNIGTVEMDITKADFVFKGTTTNLLNVFDNKTVPPGSTTSVSPIVLIDLCNGEEFCADVNVEAEPPNGSTCQDTTQYCVNSTPVAPSPVESPITSPVSPPVSVPVSPPVGVPVSPPVAFTSVPVIPPVASSTAPASPPVTSTSVPVSPPVSKGSTAPVLAPTSVELPVTPPVSPPIETPPVSPPIEAPPQPVSLGSTAPILPPIVQTAYPISPPVIPTAPVAAPKSKSSGSMSSGSMSRS
jgi:hypothetical protein